MELSEDGNLDITGNITVNGNIIANEIDSVSGTLLLGKATASKLELADTLIETVIQGPLVYKDDATMVGDLTIGS